MGVPNQNSKNNLKIGEKIRVWRDLKGIKQDDLAKMIGVSPPTMSKIEKDEEDNIKLSLVEKIADALQIEVSQLMVNPQQLFTFNDSPNSNSVYGTQHQHNYDKNMMDRMMVLMEKMTDFFTIKKSKE